MCPQDTGEKSLYDLPVRVNTFQMDNAGTNPFGEIRSLISIFLVLKKERPDVVFSFNPKTNLYGLLSCKFLGIRCVPNVSGVGNASQLAGWKALAYRTALKFAFRSANHVLFQNESDLSEYRSVGLLSDGRYSRLPGSGVDLDRFRPSPRRTGEPFVFLMACRLISQKGVVEFLEAAERVKEEFGNTEFWLAGVSDSSERAIPEQLLREFSDRGIIRFLGNVADMAGVIGEADCIVLPSWYPEGVPRILLEGAAAGKPLITTNRPGCQDVVKDGLNGYFVNAESVVSLVEVMVKILDTKPKALAAMGVESRRLAEEVFDERIVIERYLALSLGD